MLAALSGFLYFACNKPLQFAALLFAIAILFGLAVHRMRGSVTGYLTIAIAFAGSMANLFLTHFLNSMFLSAAGVYGSAIIVDRRDAGILLNDQPVSHYDTLVTTAEGEEVLTSFSEMSAAISPVRNEILIPPMNEPFVVKYVPGAEHNIVIMSDESDYGKKRLLSKAREPVDRARRLHKASPQNAKFRQQYQKALEQFLQEQQDTAPDTLLEEYRTTLEDLNRLPVEPS